LVADIDYPAELRDAVASALGQPAGDEWTPESFLHQPTSFLWHEGRFLFSAGAGVPGREGRPMSAAGDVPSYPTHTFYGELGLDGAVSLIEVGGSPVQEGSYGWLVGDEEGVHSILKTIVYRRWEENDTRTDLLSWSTGTREVLTDGVDGLGEAGRYGQLSENQWFLSISNFPDRCTSTLFASDEPPEVMEVRARCGSPSPVSSYGGSDQFGPVLTGNSAFGWLHIRNRAIDYDAGLFETHLLRPGLGEWGVLEGHSIWGQTLSRYGLTVEIYALERISTPWVVFEAPLTRSES